MSYHPSKCALDYGLEDVEGWDGQCIVCDHHHTLTWRIPRFFSIGYCKYIREYETEFVDNVDINEKKTTQFRLKIKLYGLHDDLIEIYYLSHRHVENVVIKLVLGEGVHKLNKFIHEETLIENRDSSVAKNKWQYLLSLSKKKVKDHCKKSNVLFKVTFRYHVSSIKSNYTSLEPKHQLSNSLENLLNSSMSSDVILKSAEGFEFKVHKVILSSRSTVLKGHFEHDTLENQTNIVESYLETDMLREVLTYIYTDRAPKVQEMADKLLAAAEFYHLPGLKNISAEILYLGLTKDNTIETLLLAELYSAPYLTELTLEFIKDGHASLITKTDGWKSIKSVEVIKTLYEVIAEAFDNIKK